MTMPPLVMEAQRSAVVERAHHVPFPLLPHQVLWFLLTYYNLYGGFHAMGLLCCRESQNRISPLAPLPWHARIAWFAHVISLPGTIAGAVLYMKLETNQFAPGTYDYRESEARNELTRACYITEAVIMLVDMIFGQCVLLPSHIVVFVTVWFIYSGIVLSLEAYNLNIAFDAQTAHVYAICTLVLIGTYIILSTVCALRVKCSRSPLPVSKSMYTPLSRAVSRAATTTTTTQQQPEEFPGA